MLDKEKIGSLYVSELDPEIAELLGVQTDEEQDVDLTRADVSTRGKSIHINEIRPINLNKVLSDKHHYTKIIGGSGEYGKRLHDILTKFLKAEEKDDKSMYRSKLVPAYWNMLVSLIENFFEVLTDEKQALYRYGLLNNTFLDDTQKKILLSVNNNKRNSENYYYVDEWLMMVGGGKIKQSAVDETIKLKKTSPSALREKMERKMGARNAELANLKQKIGQHLAIENGLKSCLSTLMNHSRFPEDENLILPYSADQKKSILKAQDTLKTLLKSDKELETAYRTLQTLDEEITALRERGGEDSIQVDTKTVNDEFSTLRQMIKMTVGRQGNHFPFLIKSYAPSSERDVCTKQNLGSVLKNIESIDAGIFIRKYKQEEHRIVPNFIIVPSYGEFGICWEPFERSNKATGKGRIAMPMFTRDLQMAALYALGDLRWQIAKEKALHYWMEEGLTGHYYQYFQDNKMKGDLKDTFIQDYILWIKFESQGMQKLHREVRSIFWRYIPFSQEMKETLKNRGFYYSELYKRDQNRALSRGY
jgi:hypothetical protein